ncbi:MAG: hypothetical protein ABSG17_04030 [Spirochaetia bacterium]
MRVQAFYQNTRGSVKQEKGRVSRPAASVPRATETAVMKNDYGPVALITCVRKGSGYFMVAGVHFANVSKCCQ